ncbi:MAG: protein rep [Pyrinomonadaceae bacterium]
MQTLLKTQKLETASRDVVGIASYKSTQGLQIASRIESGVRDAVAQARALAVAVKVRECSGLENVWHGDSIHNDVGELYEAAGALAACSERLCPNCLSKRSQRARARARGAVSRVRVGRQEAWRLVTLTMPTLRGVSIETSLKILDHAWVLFRKKRYWRELCRAGVKGVEFTLGDERTLKREAREWDIERDGYHPHIHILVCSRWIVWADLRKEFTESLLAAFDAFGIEETINTRDGLAVCDVRLAVDRRPSHERRGVVSLESAVNEVCKYITKNNSWLKVPTSQLVEVAGIERWPRMFELLGDCREWRTDEEIEALKAKRRARECDQLRRAELARAGEGITTEERYEALQASAEIVTETRWEVENNKFVRREVETVNDFKLLDRVRESLAWGDEPDAETLAALKARTAYLDTQNLSDGKTQREGLLLRARARGRPLKDIGVEMIGRGQLEEFKELVAAKYAEVRSYRRSQLSWRYPFATFRTLGGAVWYGLRSNPAASKF